MDISQLSEPQLVVLAADRHQGAQQQLYRRYADPIYRYLVSQVRNSHDAEDLTQETFIRALNGLSTFRGVASFKNWLYSIAKNQVADYYRDQYSKTVELDESLPPRQWQTDGREQAESQRRSIRLLNRLFKQMPDRYSRVLTLRFLRGFSLKETASEMRLTLSNTKVLQYRALRMAKQKAENF